MDKNEQKWTHISAPHQLGGTSFLAEAVYYHLLSLSGVKHNNQQLVFIKQQICVFLVNKIGQIPWIYMYSHPHPHNQSKYHFEFMNYSKKQHLKVQSAWYFL